MEKVKSFFLLVGLMVFASVVGFAFNSEGENLAAGQMAFMENKCNLCHSVDSNEIAKRSEKMKGRDLSDVGNEISSAEYVKGWLRQSELKDGEKHKKKFTGTDEELESLANWVMSLKKAS